MVNEILFISLVNILFFKIEGISLSSNLILSFEILASTYLEISCKDFEFSKISSTLVSILWILRVLIQSL